MASLPKLWYQINDPEQNLYKLVMITGWSKGGDMKNHVCLYVLGSLDGFLSESFAHDEIGKVWTYWTGNLPERYKDKYDPEKD